MSGSRTNLSPVSELAIDLDRNGGDALHRQIEASIRQRIRSGALPAGVALPPTRALAAELGVTRGVVVEAYAQLVAEGYLTSRSGGYTQVAPAGRPHAPPAAAPGPGRPAPSRPPRPVVDFGYGRGNLAAFPRAAWLRSVRRVLTEAADERLGYLDGRGAVELRSALAAYLNRVRGTNADPETIVITNGYAQAVSLLLGVLAARGARTVAVEDPSASDDARPIAQALGLNVVGVPVGDDGVRVDAVAELDADVLILTPSHQWPTGGVLSPQARAAVLGVGAADRSAGPRGRLRRRIPLRPRPDRRHAGPGSRPGRLRGDREQDPGARVPARLAHPAAGARRAVRRSQAAGRPRLPHPGPADLR